MPGVRLCSPWPACVAQPSQVQPPGPQGSLRWNRATVVGQPVNAAGFFVFLGLPQNGDKGDSLGESRWHTSPI